MNSPVAVFKRKREQTTPVRPSSVETSTCNSAYIHTTKRKRKNDDASPITKQKNQVCTDVSKVAIYHCTNCKVTYDNGDEYVKHSFSEHSVKLYICQMSGCIKTYSSQNGLRTHCRTIHGDELICSICKSLSLSLEALEDHKKSHDSGKHQCQGCHRAFTRSNDHFKHWRYSCPNNPNKCHKCKHCLRVRNGEDKLCEVEGGEPGLIDHLAAVHKLCGSHLCIHCHRLFVSSKKLIVHQQKCSKHSPCPPLEQM